MCSVREMAEASAVSVAGGDLGSSEGPAVVPPRKGHEEGFAGSNTHEFNRVFNGLGAPHVELHAPFDSEGSEAFDRQSLGCQDLLFMEILAGQLWQLLELRYHRLYDALVTIAEVDRRVPHLEV